MSTQLRVTQLPFFYEYPELKGVVDKSLTIVGHRRMGKSTGGAFKIAHVCKQLIAHEKIFKIRGDVDSYNPIMHFYAPTKNQARDIIWNELKKRLSPYFPSARFNNHLLTVTIKRPLTKDTIEIKLMASKQHDRSRGSKLWLVILDEFQDSPPDALFTSIQPALRDSDGELIVTGTPKGKDHFYDWFRMKIEAGANTAYFPVGVTGVFTPEELEAIKSSTSESAYLREYECQFLAPVEGAFFYDKLLMLDKEEWFRTGEYNPHAPLILSCDIGIAKGFASWLFQVIRGEIHVQGYYDDYTTLKALKDDLYEDGFEVDTILIPHDGEKKQISAYKETKIKDVFRQVFRSSMIKKVKKTSNKMASIENANDNLHILRLPPADIHDIGLGYRKLKEYSRKKDPNTGMYLDIIDKSRGSDHAGDAMELLFTGLGVRNGIINKRFEYKQMSHSIRQGTLTGFENRGSIFNEHEDVGGYDAYTRLFRQYH